MYRSRPDIYRMLDTLNVGMKEELLEYLKADIAAAKAAPKKSYLEEQWAEIMRLIENLKYEPYIDDQIEIEEIWNICEELIKSGKIKKESWTTRSQVIKSIISGEFFDYYGVYDPMHDLCYALMLTPQEKVEVADFMFGNRSSFLMQEGAKLYKESGQMEKYIWYIEQTLGNKQKPYMEVIYYYRDKNPARAVEIAERGLEKCRDDQTDIMIFLIQKAKDVGDDDEVKRLLKSAKQRRAVDYLKVQKSIMSTELK